MKILYFGIYDPDYSRNRVLIKGLQQNGVEVLQCQVSAKDRLWLLKLAFKYIKFIGKFQVVIVGFPGQEVMFLARLLFRKPIIFDAFTSHYEGYIQDRQYYTKTSWRAKYYRFLDKCSCILSDLVLLDTETHIDFFIEEFGLPRNKFRRIFVGTDSEVFYPVEIKNNQNFLVHFHGSYIPLQGVQNIIKAAKLLEDDGVIFNLIGKGQTYDRDRKLAIDLGVKNINFIEYIPYNALQEYINKADICLGIFGDTNKAERVIPNKIFEALACMKPVITSDTKAVGELFRDREHILLCKQGDGDDLASKIMELKNNPQLTSRIAEGGYNLFKDRLTEVKIGRELQILISHMPILNKSIF